jgi:glycosyltransferase involved in cell wall biosynthesis
MRIVLVTNGLRYGGAERIVEALAVGLTEAGDSVHVIATTRDGEIGDALRKRHIPVSVLHIQSAYDARVPLKLALVARRFGAEIMHSHLAVADIATAAARWFIPSARIVTTVHSAYVGLGSTARRLWRIALPQFDRIVAVSEAVKSCLPGSLSSIVVRPSLIDEEHSPMSRAEARRMLGVPDGVRLVMSVGRLVPVKGFDLLARAAKLLDSEARVMVIGEGPDRSALEKEPAVELLGARDDAARLLAAADVVVSPSRSEGFPQIVLEAMAQGLPVVATEVGGTPELITEGVTGFLVPPENPMRLAQAIHAVLEDRDRARRLGEAARARVHEGGLIKKAMVEKMRAVYRDILPSIA